MSDYRRFPLGAQIDGGTIQTCPKCQNTALASVNTGKLWFTHADGAYEDDQGNLCVGSLQCGPFDVPQTPPEPGE